MQFPVLAPGCRNLEVQRYGGEWLTLASTSPPYQRGCTDSRAFYDVHPDGTIDVTNACVRRGEVDVVRGTASPVGPGRWEVAFPGQPRIRTGDSGNYWLLWLSDDYSLALVSGGDPRTPGTDFWLLGRTLTPSPCALTALLRDVPGVTGVGMRLETHTLPMTNTQWT